MTQLPQDRSSLQKNVSLLVQWIMTPMKKNGNLNTMSLPPIRIGMERNYPGGLAFTQIHPYEILVFGLILASRSYVQYTSYQIESSMRLD